MANQQCTTCTHPDTGISRICRAMAVERLSMENEVKTLIITANYAHNFLSGDLEALPEDFFSCIEEMKELIESLDTSSLEFEKRSLTLKRKKRRLLATATRQQEAQR